MIDGLSGFMDVVLVKITNPIALHKQTRSPSVPNNSLDNLTSSISHPNPHSTLLITTLAQKWLTENSVPIGAWHTRCFIPRHVYTIVTGWIKMTVNSALCIAIGTWLRLTSFERSAILGSEIPHCKGHIPSCNKVSDKSETRYLHGEVLT